MSSIISEGKEIISEGKQVISEGKQVIQNTMVIVLFIKNKMFDIKYSDTMFIVK